MGELDYNLRLFQKLKEKAKEIGLRYDPENPVPSDDKLADEVFEAALTLAAEIGVYATDHGRVFYVSEDEIKEAVKAVPREITVGAGRDSRRMIARRPDERSVPFIWGATAAPYEERLCVPIAQSVASLPIDGYGQIFNMWDIAGRRIRGTPLETYATRRAVEWAREGIRRAGKAGLHLSSYPLNTKASVILGSMDSDHLRPTDGVCCSHLPEGYKLQDDVLISAHVAHEYGCFVFDNVSADVGGFAGTFETAVIHNLAANLLGAALLKYDYTLNYVAIVQNFDLSNTPECVWAKNLIIQAGSRNTNLKNIPTFITGSEPGLERWFLETAAQIGSMPSGTATIAASGRPNRPKRLNVGGPLDIKWCIELTLAGSKLNRKEANDIVKEILPLIPMEELAKYKKGLSFDEGYDMITFKPKKELSDLYGRMYNRIKDFGIPLE